MNALTIPDARLESQARRAPEGMEKDEIPPGFRGVDENGQVLDDR